MAKSVGISFDVFFTAQIFDGALRRIAPRVVDDYLVAHWSLPKRFNKSLRLMLRGPAALRQIAIAGVHSDDPVFDTAQKFERILAS